MTLREFFTENPKTAIGFSGGADSAYLLYAGIKCGADIQPYYVQTAFQPQFEYDDAVRLCKKLDKELRLIQLDIFTVRGVTENSADRCYYCKLALFGALKDRAAADGYRVIIDGTNASDDLSERPGAKALSELSVRSPLRECLLTKNKIRELSKTAGLFTHSKPAYACLATRVPTGQTITEDILKRVEMAENELFKMGFSDFRVRIHGEAARIQVLSRQLEKAAAERENIREKLKPYFNTILLDTETRGD